MGSINLRNVPEETMRDVLAWATWFGKRPGEFCIEFLRAKLPRTELTLEDGTVPEDGRAVLGFGFEALAPRPALEAESVKEIISRGATKRSGGRGRGEARNPAKELPRPAEETEDFGFEQEASHEEVKQAEEPKPVKAKAEAKPPICPNCEKATLAEWGPSDYRCSACQRRFPKTAFQS